jgi:ribonuclease HI
MFESPNGQPNSPGTTSPSNPEQQSNHKSLQTSSLTRQDQHGNKKSPQRVWTIHCDGAWCHAGAGAATIITSPAGVKYRYATHLSFALETYRCTNNIAEYEAVILGLRKLRALGVATCIIRIDSKVVVGQVEEYSAKDPALMQYLTAVRSLERQFKGSPCSMSTATRTKRPMRWPKQRPRVRPCPPTCSTTSSACQLSVTPKVCE